MDSKKHKAGSYDIEQESIEEMPVVPVITTTAETTLRWSVDGETFHKTVGTGTREIPELELRRGENTVSVTGGGTTIFTYRQGRL